MAEYITKKKAVEIIEQRRKELCPVGRYGRNYVYGSDREKYDAWEEIIDEIENMDTADVAEVRHGRWVNPHWRNSDFACNCSACGVEAIHREYRWHERGIYPICPNCGARMYKEADHEVSEP